MPRKKPEFHHHEIVLELQPDVHPHHLPHYLDLKKKLEPQAHDFGITVIDKLIKHLLPQVSITRVYIPHDDIEDTLKNRLIGEHYSKEEEDLGIANTYLLTFEKEHLPLQKICNRLKKLPQVKDAHPNYLVETYHRYITQAQYSKAGLWGLDFTKCQQAWKIEKGIPEVKIAVIDTGIDPKHEVFRDKICENQYDFVHKTTQLNDPFRFQLIGDYHTPDPDPTDYSGHGTQCAGVAAGNFIKSNGFSGVCPGATVLPLRVFYSYKDMVTRTVTDKGSEVDISAAIHYAVNAGADIISMSFGGSKKIYQLAIEYAEKHNVCLFAASGNEGYSAATYPAADKRVMAVGAINSKGKKTPMSNYGSHYLPFVLAPGQDILCPHLDDSYYHLTGTSIATPFVAGAAGLMLSLAKRHGKISNPKEIYQIIGETATVPDGKAKQDKFYGDGILNIEKALKETAKRLSIKI